MKRDMDLIREILLWLEAQPIQLDEVFQLGGEGGDFTPPGYTPDQIEAHATLMLGAGLVEGPKSQTDDGIWVFRITWAGYDFIEAVRDPKIWQRTKQGAASAGGFTVELLGDLAKGFLKKQIEERTGIQM
jgi:hypothetical protein